MSFNYTEIIKRLKQKVYRSENSVSNILELLKDLDIYSVRNYQEELQLSNALSQLTHDELSFRELLNQLMDVDISLLEPFKLEIVSHNIYINEFLSAIRNRLNQTDLHVEGDLNPEATIPLADLAMYLFRELRFYSDGFPKEDLLIKSIMEDDVHMFKAFHLNNEINMEYRNYYHESFIHLAAYHNASNMITYLSENGFDLNDQNDFKETPLQIALLKGHKETFLKLIELGASVNYTDDVGNTPLHIASAQNKANFVEWLLQAQANVNLKNNEHLMPIEMAIYYDADEVLAVYLNHFEKMDNLPLSVAYYHAFKCFQLLDQLGYDFTLSDSHGVTPLHKAVLSGHFEMVKLLVDKGLSVDGLDHEKLSPLHYASSLGHIEIARYLISKGANINLQASNDYTPLYYAVYYSNTELVECLLDHGANVHLKIRLTGSTPLHQAILKGKPDLVKLLVNKGASVNQLLNSKSTPLYLAIFHDELEIVRFLLEKGANVNERVNAIYPLHLAVNFNKKDMVKLLIEYQADVNVKSRAGSTPLHFAASNNQIELVKLLIEANANPYIRNKVLFTPKMSAYFHRNKQVYPLLKAYMLKYKKNK